VSRRGLLPLCCLLLLSGCRTPTAQEARDARDEVTNAALETAMAGCKLALADPDTEWESPDAANLCVAVALGACPK
jgi:hypothetical protein